jgi:CRISPR/Cas system-associated protein Csm6
MAMARAQRDPALSPVLALSLDERLQQLAGDLASRRGNEADRDWARGLARLLKDREALDKALAEPRRAPQIPPGMPIGSGGED